MQACGMVLTRLSTVLHPGPGTVGGASPWTGHDSSRLEVVCITLVPCEN
jgi:hypothetical protein